VPRKYHTNNFTYSIYYYLRVKHTKYSLERTKIVRRCEDNHGEKNRHDASLFNWTTFSYWFETSSAKLQNVRQSVSAVV